MEDADVWEEVSDRGVLERGRERVAALFLEPFHFMISTPWRLTAGPVSVFCEMPLYSYNKLFL